MMQRHFVTFYSPGTFVAESDTLPIDDWDVDAAVKLSKDIVQRYGARPYGFYFSTRARTDDELDSKVVAKSCMYYLGGKVETLAEIEARADPDERTLLLNMKGNKFEKVIRTTEGWQWTQPLRDGDVVLEID